MHSFWKKAVKSPQRRGIHPWTPVDFRFHPNPPRCYFRLLI